MDKATQVSIDALARVRERLRAERSTQSSGQEQHEWPEPKPLPSGLAPVDSFSFDFLPDALAPWVEDVAHRLQCPPDYVAVAALVSLGAVIGRRIGIKPQAKTDWVEVPNLWGCFIGRSGMLKSPAMMEALKPIHRLEAEAAKQNEIDQKAYELGLSNYKIKAQVAAMLAKKELKKTGKIDDLKFDAGNEPEEPLPTRYRTNDSSYEAIGELLIAIPQESWWSEIKCFHCSSISTAKTKQMQVGFTRPLGQPRRPIPSTGSCADIAISRPRAFRFSAILNPHGSANTSAAPITAALAATDSFNVLASWFGPTRPANGATLTSTRTPRRARPRGRCLKRPPRSTSTQRSSSAPRKGLMTRCRLCASTRGAKRTSSTGGQTWKGNCVPANSRPPLRVISRSIASSSRRWR